MTNKMWNERRTFAVASRAGIALIYLAFAMIVLVLLLVFALDVGRLHLVKTQLQATADGAARAGARSIMDQTFNVGVNGVANSVNSSMVSASAQNIAKENTLDGTT